MSSHYIRALALRHAAIERQIEAEMKSPLPDTLEIMRLKKLKLACRDGIREAIRKKRKSAPRRNRPSGIWRAPTPFSSDSQTT